jgi:TIR domain-containing protein
MNHIFISYRSTDVPYAAALLDNALVQRFGSARVFRDSRSLRPGAEFDPEIMRAVRNSTAMLVVIGPGWAGATDRDGRRQIDKDDDFIHREVVEALRHDVRVVPVLIEVKSLTSAALPEDLAGLAKRQDRTVRMRESAADVLALLDALAETLPGFADPEPERVPTSCRDTIRADRIGAIFNERVRVDGDLNIK